jgi:hypothetical protein
VAAVLLLVVVAVAGGAQGLLLKGWQTSAGRGAAA